MSVKWIVDNFIAIFSVQKGHITYYLSVGIKKMLHHRSVTLHCH